MGTFRARIAERIYGSNLQRILSVAAEGLRCNKTLDPSTWGLARLGLAPIILESIWTAVWTAKNPISAV